MSRVGQSIVYETLPPLNTTPRRISPRQTENTTCIVVRPLSRIRILFFLKSNLSALAEMKVDADGDDGVG